MNYYWGIPVAAAQITGSKAYPSITGTANFYHVPGQTGIFLEIEVHNLPPFPENAPSFLGLHIHENGDCSNNLQQTGSHYNPTNTMHPHHLGDLPPLLNNNGIAHMTVYDFYLSPADIINRSIIIHSQRDDFTSQPSGDSGDKIACGVILPAQYTNRPPSGHFLPPECF